MARRTFDELVEITDAGADVVETQLANNTVVQYQLAGSDLYSGTLAGIHTLIEDAARDQVMEQVNQAGGIQNFSEINIQSMMAVEAFRQVSGLDLTAVLLRAHYLRIIQTRNLLVNHPAQYSNLNEMAAQNGCSVSDMLATLDMVNILFPYVERELGLPVHELWSALGKSKIKEMLPVLKSLITGDESDTATTRNAVERLINDQFAGFANDPDLADAMALLRDENTPEADRLAVHDRLTAIARRNIVEHLIDLGGNLPVMEVRRHLRPERTPVVPLYLIPDGRGGYLLTAQVSSDQMTMIRNKMGERMEYSELQLPADTRARQADAFRVPLLRRLYEEVFGGA